MKITIKKNLIVFHKPHEWNDVMNQLVAEYGPSIRISWRSRRDLGFTVRYHKGLVLHHNPSPGFHYEEQVHLDFFNESAQSWFLLKIQQPDSG